MNKNDLENSLSSAASRLKEVREVSGMNQKEFADFFCVNHTTYNRYENGGIDKMPMTLIENICRRFNINPSWLAGYPDVEKYMIFDKVFETTKRIPVVGTIAADQPLLASEEILGYEHTIESQNIDFCLRVKGDSMTGARIYDGDIAFITKQSDVDSGDIAAVIIDGEDAALKRIFKVDNTIILHPENPKYQDIVISKKDFKKIQIVGKVKTIKFNV